MLAETPIAPAEIPSEIERFQKALEEAKDELRALKEEIAGSRGIEHLYVIDTHLLILEDTMLVSETISLIEHEKINAEAALKRTLKKFKEFFAGIEDEYLRERSGDIETVVERVLRRSGVL